MGFTESMMNNWLLVISEIDDAKGQFEKDKKTKTKLLKTDWKTRVKNKTDEKNAIQELKNAFKSGILSKKEKQECLNDLFEAMYNRRAKSILPSQYRDYYRKNNLTKIDAKNRVDKILSCDFKGQKTALTKQTVTELKKAYAQEAKARFESSIGKNLGEILKILNGIKNSEELLDKMEDITMIQKSKELLETLKQQEEEYETQSKNWDEALKNLETAVSAYDNNKKTWGTNKKEWLKAWQTSLSVLQKLLETKEHVTILNDKGIRLTVEDMKKQKT